MSDSVWPHRWQPTRLPRSWDSPGKNTGEGCHFLPQCIKVKSESEVAQSCPTLATPWTAAYQAPPSMGFSRQKYWSGVPLPSPIYTLPYVKQIASGKLLYNTGSPGCALWRPRWVRWQGWEGGSRGRGYIYMTDLRCCMAQTITTL